MPANKRGWKINFDELYQDEPDEAARSRLEEFVIPSPDDAFAAAIYAVSESKFKTEASMALHLGKFALFADKTAPSLILDPKGLTVCGRRNAARWASPTLVYTVEYCTADNGSLLGLPIVLIDVEERAFSYLPLESSLPYRLTLRDAHVQIVEDYKDPRIPSPERDTFSIEQLMWIDTAKLGAGGERYLQARKAFGMPS